MVSEQFKLAVKKIAAENKEDFDGYDWYVTVEPDASCLMNFTVERHDDELIVQHYWKQRGDLMYDLRIIFRIKEDDWIPIVYRQSPMIYDRDKDGLDKGIDSLLSDWAVELEDSYVGINSESNQGDQ